MRPQQPILTITGSDTTSRSGIQADIKTISDLGGYATSVVTSIVIQNSKHVIEIHDMPSKAIASQIKAIFNEFHPRYVKVGLVRGVETIRDIRSEILGCRSLVLSPGIYAFDGTQIVDDDSIEALKHYLVPLAKLLIVRRADAEKMLGIKLCSHDEMIIAAKKLCDMGAENVIIRGVQQNNGQLIALLYLSSTDEKHFFASHNIVGWQKHGVGTALSTAITTCLANGEELNMAIKHAHDYVRQQVVYVTDAKVTSHAIEVYNSFLTLVANHYTKNRDVEFYSNLLSMQGNSLTKLITPVTGKTPKKIIQDYTVLEAKRLMDTTALTFQQISDRLNFPDLASFSRFFSKNAGCTLSQYGKRK